MRWCSANNRDDSARHTVAHTKLPRTIDGPWKQLFDVVEIVKRVISRLTAAVGYKDLNLPFRQENNIFNRTRQNYGQAENKDSNFQVI